MVVEHANTNNSKQKRIIESLLEQVQKRYDSDQAGTNRLLAYVFELERKLSYELKGLFTKSELSLIADAENGTMITPQYWGNKRMLLIQLEDANQFDNISEKWDVDFDNLIGKIKNIPDSLLLFLHEEIYRFWNESPAYGSPTPNLDAFTSKYCTE